MQGFCPFAAPATPCGGEKPLKAYQRIVGVVGSGTQTQQDAPALRRNSINDVLRTQINALMASPALSADDRLRLQQHLDSVRDLEIAVTQLALEQALLEDMATVDKTSWAWRTIPR